MSASNNNTGSIGNGSGENSTDNSQLRDVDNNITPPSTPSSDGYEADAEIESNADAGAQDESDDESETAEAVAPPTAASAVLDTAIQELSATAAGILYEAVMSMFSSDSESDTDSETETADEDGDEDEGTPQGLGLPTRVDYLTPGNVNGALEQSNPATTGVAREQDSTCHICLEELTDTDPADIRVIMECGHRFHSECLLTWFDTYPGCHCTCPVDRWRLFTNPGHEHCGEEHGSEEAEEGEESEESE